VSHHLTPSLHLLSVQSPKSVEVALFYKATVTNCHKLGGLINMKIYSFTVLEAGSLTLVSLG
jgi:hypothetical protein